MPIPLSSHSAVLLLLCVCIEVLSTLTHKIRTNLFQQIHIVLVLHYFFIFFLACSTGMGLRGSNFFVVVGGGRYARTQTPNRSFYFIFSFLYIFCVEPYVQHTNLYIIYTYFCVACFNALSLYFFRRSVGRLFMRFV